MLRTLAGFAALAGMLIAAETSDHYAESIRAWQQDRDAGLRAEDGWLTLVGLFWLKPGDNTLGSAPGNDFVLPHPAPAQIGRIRLAGDKVTLVDPSGKSRELSYAGESPDVVAFGPVSFFVIRRGDRFALRAKDSESPARKNFEGMRYFPVTPALRFQAKLIPDPQKIPILNVLGQTEMEESPGWAEFQYQGQTYRLRPIYEGKTLFFLFKDLTNKTSTYQAGRMLNVPLPVDGIVDLDFNKSYNPPCTFTPYATCPLPPKENHLPIAIEAGELRYKNGHPYETSSK